MNRSLKVLFAVASATTLSGCDTEFDQVVVVRVITSGNQVVQGLSLRYHAEADCKGVYVAASTSTTGEARFLRKAIRGDIGVLLEEPSICFERDGAWYSAWQEHIDPANRENFLCTFDQGHRASCERLSQGGA